MKIVFFLIKKNQFTVIPVYQYKVAEGLTCFFIVYELKGDPKSCLSHDNSVSRQVQRDDVIARGQRTL